MIKNAFAAFAAFAGSALSARAAIMICILSLCSTASLASVTYSYTGNYFDDISPVYIGSTVNPYTTSDRVLGSLTFDSALSAGDHVICNLSCSSAPAGMTAFSFSDGVHTVGFGEITTNDYIRLSVDSSGQVTDWDILLLKMASLESYSEISTTKSFVFAYYSYDYSVLHYYSGQYFLAGSTTGPGQWATITSAVPEPETYAMLFAGLGLMGFVLRRRMQSATST